MQSHNDNEGNANYIYYIILFHRLANIKRIDNIKYQVHVNQHVFSYRIG